MTQRQKNAVLIGVVGTLLALFTFRQNLSHAIFSVSSVCFVAVSTFFYKGKWFPSWTWRVPRLPRWTYIVFAFFFVCGALWFYFEGSPLILKEVEIPVSEETEQIAPIEETRRRKKNPVQKKIVALLTDDNFTESMSTITTDGKVPEHLTSMSKFQDYLVEGGITEVKNVDLTNHFLKIFQKYFPGKVPSDLDVEMKRQLIEIIEKMGYESGHTAFQEVRENAIWLAARFDPTLDMGAKLGRWPEFVLSDDFGDTGRREDITVSFPSQRPDTAAPPRAIPLQDTPAIEVSENKLPPKDVSLQIPNENIRENTAEVQGTPENPLTFEDFEDFEDFENRFLRQLDREIISPQRVNAAMQTLNQYGYKDGLERLKASDPEFASAIQRFIEKKQEVD